MSSDDDERDRDPEPSPPGQFMSERIEADTKRFLEQARELARRRAEARPREENGK